MIDINLKSRTPEFEYFSTGQVIEHPLGEPTCTVRRTEGGILKQVPILGMYGAGGQDTGISYNGCIEYCYVALIKIQGIYCVLGTIPNFFGGSNYLTYNASNLKKEDA